MCLSSLSRWHTAQKFALIIVAGKSPSATFSRFPYKLHPAPDVCRKHAGFSDAGVCYRFLIGVSSAWRCCCDRYYVYAISIHFVGIRLSIQQSKLHPRTSQNAIGISEQQRVHLSGALFETSWWPDAWYSWVVVHLPIGLLIRYATIWRRQAENSPIIREGNLEATRSWCQKGRRFSMNNTCRPTAYTP